MTTFKIRQHRHINETNDQLLIENKEVPSLSTEVKYHEDDYDVNYNVNEETGEIEEVRTLRAGAKPLKPELLKNKVTQNKNIVLKTTTPAIAGVAMRKTRNSQPSYM